MPSDSHFPAYVAYACALVLVAWPRVALAQARPSGAETMADLRQRGNDAMSDLRPADAIDFYRRAYAISHDPALLYNLGRAHEAVRDYAAAITELEQFSREAPQELKARVPQLPERIAELRTKVTAVSLARGVPGARVLVRDRVVGEIPQSGALRLVLVAGPAPIEISAPGYLPLRRQVELLGGQSIELRVDLVAEARGAFLTITSTPPGAEIAVDGEGLGAAPVEASVEAGSHRIVASRVGYHSATTTHVIGRGERKTIDMPLERVPPITARWWFWTGIGVVVIGGVATTVALLTERPASSGTLPPGQIASPLVVW